MTLVRAGQTCAVLLAALALATSPGQAQQRPPSTGLTRIILAQDSALFAAFNACDTVALARFFAPDVEFYHDKTGLTTSRDSNVAVIAERCRRVAKGAALPMRRELVVEGTEVYPVPGYGAIQVGRHLFSEVKPGESTPKTEFRFVHLWHQVGSGWELARIVSYGH